MNPRTKNKFKNIFYIIFAILLILVPIIILFTGCSFEPTPPPPDSSYEASAKANEKAIQDMISTDSLPEMTRSLARENIKRRTEYINQPDRVGYLYLVSENGQLIEEIQVLGMVSSLNSYLTPMEDIQIVEHDGGQYDAETPIATEAADLDGTWGENSDGIFWFTMDGVYGEWSGLYRYNAERLSYSSPPLLIQITE